METKDWIVTYYDKKDREIESYEILDRTEQSASKEVMHDVEKRRDVEDWTMVPKRENTGTQKSPFGIGA